MWDLDRLCFVFRWDHHNVAGSRLKVDLNQAEERLTCELEQELARVKSDLDAAGQQEHNMNEEDEIISQDLLQSEAQVRSLRTQMDQLTQEIKQANLQSLSIAPTDDLKILLEGNSLFFLFDSSSAFVTCLSLMFVTGAPTICLYVHMRYLSI